MVEMYTKEGCDFSSCTTAEEKLAQIEAFEDERNAKAAEEAKAKAEAEAQNAELSATSLASIAAQLEYQNMMTLEDVEEV
jgi:RPA family protein